MGDGAANGVALDMADHDRLRRSRGCVLGRDGKRDHRGAALRCEETVNVKRPHLDGKWLHIVARQDREDDPVLPQVANNFSHHGPVLGLQVRLNSQIRRSFLLARSRMCRYAPNVRCWRISHGWCPCTVLPTIGTA